VRGSCDGRTAGMLIEAVMAEPWDGVGIAAMARTYTAKEGASGVGAMLTLVMKSQWVC
jgi:hypothetical protein